MTEKELAQKKRLENLAKARAAKKAKTGPVQEVQSRESREDFSARIDREFEDRNADLHEPYRPPGTLPDVDPGVGYKMRWVRRILAGNLDNINLHRAHQERWEPMTLAEYPQYAALANHGADNLEIGDLVAMRTTVEQIRKREAYYQGMTDNKLAAIDSNYMGMDNKRVKTFKEVDKVYKGS